MNGPAQRILYVGNDPVVISQLETAPGSNKIEKTDQLELAAYLATSVHFDVYVVDRDITRVSDVNFCCLLRELHEEGAIISMSHDASDKIIVAEGCADVFLKKPQQTSRLGSVIEDLSLAK